MDEKKIMYNFFYLVAKDILEYNDKTFTPYELHKLAEAMSDDEGVSDFRNEYMEGVLELLDEVE